MANINENEKKNFNKKNIIKYLLAIIFYGGGVFLSESSFGNPDFPIDIWIYRFTTIQPYLWSLPVHIAGFILIVLCGLLKTKRKFILATTTSMGYFIVMELINAFGFNFFIYRDLQFGGWIGAFLIVILLYFVLCSITCFILYGKLNFMKFNN